MRYCAGLWQRCELLVRGHHVFVAITFFLFAFGIDHGVREEAWPMVIQIRDQMLLIEGVDEHGIALRDVGSHRKCLRTVAAFLPSTKALSLVRRERDLRRQGCRR